MHKIDMAITSMSRKPIDAYNTKLGTRKNTKSFSWSKKRVSHRNNTNDMNLFAYAIEVTVMNAGRGTIPIIFDAIVTSEIVPPFISEVT